MSKILRALSALQDLEPLKEVMQIYQYCREMTWLDTNIAAYRDPDHIPEEYKKDMDPERPITEYCWLVQLAPGMYLSVENEGGKVIHRGENLCGCTNQLQGINRWREEDAREIATDIERAKTSGDFRQLSGKEEYDVIRGGTVQAYPYVQALCDRREEVLKDLKQLGVDKADQIFGTAPRTMAELLDRMDRVHEMRIEIEKKDNFPDIMELLKGMGIMPPGKETLH